MPEKKHQCPSCGAELVSKHIYVKKLVCNYCGQIALVNANGLITAQSKNNPLLDYSSVLRLNMKASAHDVQFEVRGRIRFNYASGYWDEWAVILQGAEEKNVWIQEDDGALIAFTESEKEYNYSDITQFEIGDTYKVGDDKIFITEKGDAVVSGYEGEIVSENDLASTIKYWDGILVGSGRIISIEFVNGQYTAFEGRPLSVDCIGDIDIPVQGSQKDTLMRTSLSPVKQITCSSCGAALSLFRNTSGYYACNYCQSVLDARSKEARLLEVLDTAIPVRSFIKLGYCILLKNKLHVAVGCTRWRNRYYEMNSTGGYDYETWEYDEWLFAAEDGSSVYICEDSEGFTLSEELYPEYPNVNNNAGMHTFDSNIQCAAKEYGDSEVIFFEGESTYHIRKGDLKKFAEYHTGNQSTNSVEYRFDTSGKMIEVEFFCDRNISSDDLKKYESQMTPPSNQTNSIVFTSAGNDKAMQRELFSPLTKETMSKSRKIVRKLPYSFNRKLFLILSGMSIIACIILAANASRFGGGIFNEQVKLCAPYSEYPKNIIPCYQVPLFTCNNSLAQTSVTDTASFIDNDLYDGSSETDFDEPADDGDGSYSADSVTDNALDMVDANNLTNAQTEQIHEVFCAETPYFNVDPSMKICELVIALPLGSNDKSVNADIAIINSSGTPVMERNVEFFTRNSYYSSSESLEKFNEKLVVDKIEKYKIKITLSSVYTDFDGTQLEISFLTNRVQSEFFTLAIFFFLGLGLIFMRKRRVKV